MNKKCASRKKGSFRKNQDYDKKSKSSKDVESNVDANKGFNDFSWYNKNPILLESAARIPFAVPTGGEVNAGTLYWNAGSGTEAQTKSWATSGVMALDVSPAIGYSDSPDSPATIAAREIYAKVRKVYSGTLAVDAPDFMMYLLALDGIFSYIARLKRIYRTINVYSGVNKYTPDVLLGMNLGLESNTGTNVILDSLRNNKTKLWGGINTLIHNVSKFTCPAIMDIFNRHYWMNDNYFMDRANRKAQIYMFRQSHFWKFGLDSEMRGSVSAVSFGGLAAFKNVDAVDYLLNFGNDLLGALNDDEDAYTINGYLQRAFEGYPMFKIDDLREDEIAEFVYSPEVLWQIHNAKIIPAAEPMKINVTQTGINSNVISTPRFKIGSAASNNGKAMPNTILDVGSELPDMPTVVVSSRLMYAYEISTVSQEDITVNVYCGTEVVNFITMATMAGSAWSTTSYSNNILTKTNLTPEDLTSIARWSTFDMAPVLTTWYIDYAKNAYVPLVMGDLTNPTSVDNDALKDLNRMCIYSEFNSFSI